jgi:hypothetical protein
VLNRSSTSWMPAPLPHNPHCSVLYDIFFVGRAVFNVCVLI